MKRFFVLYRIPVATMDEWQRNTKPEDAKAMSDKLMGEMSQWMKAHGKSFVERGAPLGRTKRVTSEGIADSRNDLCYYAIVESETHEGAAQLFADNPHLKIPTSFIEITEIPHMGL